MIFIRIYSHLFITSRVYFEPKFGLLAQLVGHCTGIAGFKSRTGLNLLFFWPYFHYCLSRAHYCEDRFHFQ